MKNTLALPTMGLAVILLSTVAFAQKAPERKGINNSRHIKMTKIENGKTMELDTVLSGNDVFVWHGDTINQLKHIKKFSPSGFDKIHRMEVENDSVQKKIIIHKRMKDGNDEERLFFLNESDSRFPPMPPIPPVPHMKMMRMQHSGRIIDLNDPNIISFKKRKLSGDREKIEIIRKKSEEPENLNFDFEFDDEMVAPEPPEPPIFMNEENEKKEIRKEMKIEKEKAGKIEKETTPQENK